MLQCKKARYTIYDEQKRYYCGMFHEFSMRNFIQFVFRKNDFLSGRESGCRKRQWYFPGCGYKLCLVRVNLLEAGEWLECRKDFDLSANDVGES